MQKREAKEPRASSINNTKRHGSNKRFYIMCYSVPLLDVFIPQYRRISMNINGIEI